MYKLQLQAGLDAGRSRIRRSERLADIVREAEMDMRVRFRNSNIVDKSLSVTLVSDFCGIYGSVEDILNRHSVFKAEGFDAQRLAKVWGIYSGAVAVTNALADASVERLLQKEDMNRLYTRLPEEAMTKPSDLSLVGGSLRHIKDLPRSKEATLERYNLYVFFDTVRGLAKREAERCTTQATRDVLAKIEFVLPGYEFTDRSYQRRVKPKQANGNGRVAAETTETFEKLPGILPPYSSVYPEANQKDVIGNDIAKKKIFASFHQALDYDPTTGTNPHKGRGYMDRLLLHGSHGTGKNFTVDAVLNDCLDYARSLGADIEIISFKPDLRTSYKDRTALLFNHFAKMEKDSNKVYINLLNEADGLFGITGHGTAADETHKLISDAKEVMDTTSGKGIVWWLITNYPGVFENALGDRYHSVAMRGAQTAEDFRDLFMMKLRPLKNLSKLEATEDELMEAARKYVAARDMILANYNIRISGRGVDEICDKYAGFDLDNYLKHYDAVHRTAPHLKAGKLDSIRLHATGKDILQGILRYEESIIEKYATQHEADILSRRK